MNIVKRVGLATAGLLTTGALLAPAALADATCTITDNGVLSHNHCTIKTSKKTVRVQINNAKVKNSVTVISNTGGNKANGNTGGNVEVTSGDSSVNVTITNTVNSNSAP